MPQRWMVVPKTMAIERLFILQAAMRATNDCSLTFTFTKVRRSYKKKALNLQAKQRNTNFLQHGKTG